MNESEIIDACVTIITRGKKPTITEVTPIVRAFYALPENGAGGSLHVVLYDYNLENSSVQFCRDYAAERGDGAGMWLAEVLLLCSLTQRKKLAERKRG